ncbi:MAG: hypothetical protein H8E42_12010 [Nitrospinae bacterium]|nr:hypothetical protein [Nitrospinota bacterium]MBL7021166.1 hypothetical protein [Nitrospinaceae bacterium]
MVELKNEVIEKGITAPEEIKELIAAKLNPKISKLDSEINAEAKKANLLGYGSTVTTGIGLLAGSLFSVPPAFLIGLGVTGTMGGLKAISDEDTATTKLKSHPLYFLWKAQRKHK